MRRFALLAAAAIALAGTRVEARPASKASSTTFVLYTRGAGTSPFQDSRPDGFGIVTDLATAQQRIAQVVDPTLGWYNGAAWLGEHRIIVPRNGPPRPPLIYRFTDRNLRLVGAAPVPRREITPVWSYDQRLIAAEPIVACEGQPIQRCYRGSARIIVRHADGSHPRQVATGHFDSWTPDGRLLVTNRNESASYKALDLANGRRSLPIRPEGLAALAGARPVTIGPARWSADGRYIAAMIRAPWKNGSKIFGAFVVAPADGRRVRFFRSPDTISMFAWSPRGHRLAYTISQRTNRAALFVVDLPQGRPVRLYAAPRQFDWTTWSPDGRRLLLDDQFARRWLLITVSGGQKPRRLPHRGGRPLWCCPVNSYATREW